MSTTSAINYCEMFLKPDLMLILGIPTFETIHQLQQECKYNASSVHSNLGGGAHGHLRLVLHPATYALITNDLYVCPVYPVALIIQNGTTHHQAKHLEQQHKEELCVFHDT